MKNVNPHIIRWAMDWNDLTTDDLLKISKRASGWLDGSTQPTFKQLEKFAEKTHTITPYFFMDSVPDVSLQIADFRTIKPDVASNAPSPELFDTIDELLYKQAWMRDYFIAEGYDEVEWVGKYGATVKAPPIKDVADELREILGMGKHWVTDNEVTSHDDAWRYLRKIIESKRVSVVISGYAGTNTRRKYDVSEFRGFVLSDKYVPMVFINGLDAKTAQLFTLIHELVHLLLAQTGVSYPTYDEANVNTDIEIERFADSVTAEFLVPENVLKEIWSSSGNNEEINIKVAKRQFMVSEIVILRRALDTKLITRETFWRLYNNYAASKTDYENGAHKSSGGNYYATKGTKLGKVFTEAIFTALKSGYLQYGEAYKLTGMRSKVFDRYYQECGYVL